MSRFQWCPLGAKKRHFLKGNKFGPYVTFVYNLSVMPATAKPYLFGTGPFVTSHLSTRWLNWCQYLFLEFFEILFPHIFALSVTFVRNSSVIPATAKPYFCYLFFCHQSPCAETINLVSITFRSVIGRIF